MAGRGRGGGGWNDNGRGGGGHGRGGPKHFGDHQSGASNFPGKRQKLNCGYCDGENHVEEFCFVKERMEKKKARENASKGGVKKEDGLKCIAATKESECRPKWYADSGASRHLTDQLNLMTRYEPVTPDTWMVSGIGEMSLSVHGVGDVEVETAVDGVRKNATITGVLYVPGLGTSLYSIGAATAKGTSCFLFYAHPETLILFIFFLSGLKVEFDDLKFTLKRDGITVMDGWKSANSLYELNISPQIQSIVAKVARRKPISLQILHEKFGHLNYATIIEMVKEGIVIGIIYDPTWTIPTKICHGCISGKMTRSPFKSGRERATEVGGLCHADVWGPAQTTTLGGARYLLIFKDDFSGYIVSKFLKVRSEVTAEITYYAARLKTETGKCLKIFRSDNAKDFVNNSTAEFFNKKGICHQLTAPHTPQHNAVVERTNRTLIDSTRARLKAKDMEDQFWGEAGACSTYSLNRTLSRTAVERKTPYELWTGKKPDVSNLLIFGSTVYVHVPAANRQKLDAKGIKCWYMSHCENTKGIRAWDPVARKILISRDYITEEETDSQPKNSKVVILIFFVSYPTELNPI